MPRCWPHRTHVTVKSHDQAVEMLTWCHTQWGDSQYQQWCAEYAYPYLKVMFCSVSHKSQFDLTWSHDQK